MREVDPVVTNTRPSPSTPRVGRGLKAAIAAALLIGAAGAVYVIASSTDRPGAGDALRPLAIGSMAKLQTAAPGAAAPSTPFKGPDGASTQLANFRGKVVVLNLWATWCGPCVKEMPTLAALQRAYPGKVAVVALSQDRAEATAKARAFIALHAPLAFYQDADFAIMPKLNLPAAGFPTTVIYDKRGVERAYLQGDADWSSPQARAVIDSVLAE